MQHDDENQKFNELVLPLLGDLNSAANQIRSLRASERAIVFSDGLLLPDEPPQSLSEQYLEHGLRAIQKLQKEGPGARLTTDEQLGIEAVVHTVGRPALMIENGHFEKPPVMWSMLDTKRPSIETVTRSVGKIDKLIDGKRKFLGTGFLVGKQVVMTNRHVLELFGVKGERRWIVQRPAEPKIDYDGEYKTFASRDFALEDVIAVDNQLDLALVRVSSQSPFGFLPPDPLLLSSRAPEQRILYVVGYPAVDSSHRTPADIIKSIFADVFEVKRLQPGELLGIFDDENEFAHDCSTLGGNSGSCILDFENSNVAGLHYRGTYLQSNFAIALWKLRDNAMLRTAGLQFS